MKIVRLLLAIVLLGSCSSLLQFNYDKYKLEHTLRLELKLDAYIQQRGLLGNSMSHYTSVASEHFSRISDNGSKTVMLSITHEYDQLADPPDSLLYIDIDGKITKLTPNSQNTKQFVTAKAHHEDRVSKEKPENNGDEQEDIEITNTYTSDIILNTQERTKQIYIIPNELFEQFIKSKRIHFRQYIGNQPIDIIPTYSERRLIVSFYEKVIKK